MSPALSRVLSITLAVGVIATAVTVVGAAPGQAAAGWPDSASSQQIFPGGLWLNPDSAPVAVHAALVADRRTAEAETISKISSQPIATWLDEGWSTSLTLKKIDQALSASQRTGGTPVFVVYAIPNRDCGGYSAGGYNQDSYLQYNNTIGHELSGHPAVIVLEPDSISTLGTSSCTGVATSRLPLLKKVAQSYWQKNVPIYLDGGHSSWMKPSAMAQQLTDAGVQYARGFFTNAANTKTVAAEQSYAAQVSSLLGGKHFVIDVSRNGAGPQPGWCNPPNARLGQNPHIAVGSGALDALVWIKTPGESDGNCNGAPAAGKWFESGALALAGNR